MLCIGENMWELKPCQIPIHTISHSLSLPLKRTHKSNFRKHANQRYLNMSKTLHSLSLSCSFASGVAKRVYVVVVFVLNEKGYLKRVYIDNQRTTERLCIYFVCDHVFCLPCLLACSQCDQIWRNSTTLAFPNFWQCVLRPFGFGAKFLTLFGTICILLGKIHYCKWPNIENTICSSGHTACSVLHDRSVLERVNRFRTTHLGSVRCLPVWPDWANFKKVIGDDFLHKWTEI